MSKQSLLEHIDNTFQVITDGYCYYTADHWDDGYYLVVDNPKYAPDNGEDPRLILHISRATNIKEKIIEK